MLALNGSVRRAEDSPHSSLSNSAYATEQASQSISTNPHQTVTIVLFPCIIVVSHDIRFKGKSIIERHRRWLAFFGLNILFKEVEILFKTQKIESEPSLLDMELPFELKNLYRHWSKHVRQSDSFEAGRIPPETMFHTPALYEDIQAFIAERMRIWERKVSGEAPPYTEDPILGKYRFCNIFREFDRQTLEYHRMLLPIRDDFPLWLLNMFYCRMVARPETVDHVGLLSYDPMRNEQVIRRMESMPRPKFGTPYVFPVSTIMRSATPTRETFIGRHLPRVMRVVADRISEWRDYSVYDGVEEILPLFGFNHSFHWTETLIDVAYQYPEHIDLFTRFPVGPGALPTFSRINPSIDPSILAERLAMLRCSPGVTYEGCPIFLSAENWEGIGCEFRKYTNLSSGGGRHRIYPSQGG